MGGVTCMWPEMWSCLTALFRSRLSGQPGDCERWQWNIFGSRAAWRVQRVHLSVQQHHGVYCFSVGWLCWCNVYVVWDATLANGLGYCDGRVAWRGDSGKLLGRWGGNLESKGLKEMLENALIGVSAHLTRFHCFESETRSSSWRALSHEYIFV